ncbi:CapA family protein [Nakamurella sp.]|uniref:CapA family protein n=1 Tax=Nakamurella sp. TaxID=1869182 RepID=UPI0037846F49
MANGGQLRRLSITVLSVLTIGFGAAQLLPGPAAPEAGAAPAAPTSVDPQAGDSMATASPVAPSPVADSALVNSTMSTAPTTQRPAGTITLAFAGDVNFAERTADRLAADPTTVFGAAAPGLAAADLTMINLETAIATGGQPEPKSFTFRAPPAALGALRDAGVDVASMANNHAADYGADGIAESLAAIRSSGFPVIGFGADHAAAAAPYRALVGGVPVTIFAASQVPDRTLNVWTATGGTPGIASANDPQLVENVRSAAQAGETVIVFLHWGTEYLSCPDGDQQRLADQLATAGATAVIGAHAHVLQGAGWRADGTYVAYGLSNYLWWRSFGNEQDDNGVLTLTIADRRVVHAEFAPAHLDDTGVPVPATGAVADRIDQQWERVRTCADLAAEPPR